MSLILSRYEGNTALDEPTDHDQQIVLSDTKSTVTLGPTGAESR